MATYLFEIKALTPVGEPRRSRSGGNWRPSRRRQNHRTGESLWFRHSNGNATEELEGEPRHSGRFGSYSIYCLDGKFHALPYDISQHHAGDGRDNTGTRAPNDDVDSSDEDEDAEYEDWGHPKFRNALIPASYIGRRGSHRRMLTRPVNNGWMFHFLPDRYLPQPPVVSGGLVGDLPLLIGMVAMSQPPDYWAALLPRSILHPFRVSQEQQNLGPPRQNWIDGKGAVVTVYLDPRGSSQEELRRYENGARGPILP